MAYSADLSGRLAGRTALVTGGTRGIGRSICERLARDGATVWLTGRDPERASAVAAEIAHATGAVTFGIAADFADANAPAAIVREVNKTSRQLHIVVHNAGMMEEGRLGMVTAESYDTQHHVNARSGFLLVQAAARLLQRSGNGSIVLLGSIVGELGLAGYGAYSMSKAALVALTRSAADELGPSGIRVNAVAPGVIDTDLVGHLSEEQRETRRASTALRRLGTPQDIADVVAFLAGDDSRFMTGQVLRVDGGLRM